MYFRIMRGSRNKGLIVKYIDADSYTHFWFEDSIGRRIGLTSRKSFKKVRPQSKAKEMFLYAQRSQKAMYEYEQKGGRVRP